MPHRAIYPGSFDPPTLGHIDIIERASGLFDNLIVAIGVNTNKVPFLDADERLDALRECTAHLANVTVESFQGLLVEYAHSKNCSILVRGLRAISDFENEMRNAMSNRRLAGDIETVFLFTREEYSFIASSVVKEVSAVGGDYSLFVPPPVAARIATKLARNP